MTTFLYILTNCLWLGTILAVFAIRYYALVQRAKARREDDDAYKRIAERAVATQSETVSAMAAIQACITDVSARLTTVEKVLKDVE